MDTCLIRKIHSTKTKVALAITGGGTEAIGDLLRHGEGSNTLLEAIVPYNQKSTEKYIGGPPDKFVSEDTACQLAMAAWQRGIVLSETQFSPQDDPVIGIGATCSLAKEGERSGREHRVWIARQSDEKCVTLGFNVLANRETEETLVANAILNEIAIGCNLWTETTNSEGRTWNTHTAHSSNIIDVYRGLRSCASTNGSRNDTKKKLIFPGSFNPFHNGHILMAKIAREVCPLEWIGNDDKTVHFEISVRNVDKPWLTYKSVNARIKNYKEVEATCKEHVSDLWITNAPTFEEKAKIFNPCIFVVGFDTFQRFNNPKYHGSLANFNATLDYMYREGFKWIVFPRKKADGTVSTPVDVIACNKLNQDFVYIVPNEKYPEEIVDISSSSIRKNNG